MSEIRSIQKNKNGITKQGDELEPKGQRKCDTLVEKKC